MENNVNVDHLEISEGDTVCIICLQLHKDTNEYSDIEKLMHFQNVFNKVSKHLTSDVFGNCFLWNFVDEGSSPICSTCYSSVEKIFRINEKVEKLQSAIQDLVNTFTGEVLAHHKRLQDLYTKENEAPDEGDSHELENGVTKIEYKPDADIKIKDELRQATTEESIAVEAEIVPRDEDLEDDPEDTSSINPSDDLSEAIPFPDDFHTGEGSSAHVQGNNSNDNGGLNNLRIVLKRLEFEPSKSKICPSTEFPELRVVLTRLKLDAKNSVPAAESNLESSQRPKRKAAQVANDILKKISNKENNSWNAKNRKSAENYEESEEDWKSDSATESSDTDFSDIQENSEKIIQRKETIRGTDMKSRRFAIAMHFRYKCYYKKCLKKFSTIKTLKRHVEIHKINSPATPVQCTICSRKFKTNKHLVRHFHYDHKERPFQCTKCKKAFLSKLNLKLHSQTHHGKLYECERCNKKFMWRVSLDTHTLIEHSNEKYNCTVCNKQSRSRLLLQRHRSTHFTSKISEALSCNACKKVHFKEKIWDKCIIKHFRKAKKGFICAVCFAVFIKSKDLDRHSAKKKHLNKKLFTCFKCGKGLYRRKDLKDHLRVHQGRLMSGSKTVGVNAATAKSFTLENVYFKFKCNYKRCAETFGRVKQLKKHMKNHNSRVLFKCEICPKKFKSPKDLCKHNYFHHNDKQFKCGKCGKSFRKKLNLELHSKLHSGKHFECQICLKRFLCRVALNLHLRFGHNEEKYTCTICKKHFGSRINLVQHRSSHFKSKVKETFPCSGCKKVHFVEKIWDNCIVNQFRRKSQIGCVCAICTTVFRTSRELDKHSTATKHLNKRLFTCLRCKMRFYRRVDLDKHKLASKRERNKTHRKNSNGNANFQNVFKCEMCKRKFCKRLHFINHLSLFHKKGDDFCCSICKTQFKYSQDFRIHINLHVGEIPYECKMCNMKFYTRRTLRYHTKYKCTKIKNSPEINNPLVYNCDVCQKSFRSKSFLSNHLKLHKDDKGVIFGCTICGKVFNDNQTLEDHKNTHTGQRLFKCGCNELFFSSFNFIIHRRTCPISSNEIAPNSYECLFCEKVFKTENKLNLHRRIHANKRRLPCKLCGKIVGRKSMRYHLRTHSAEKFKCGQCNMIFNIKSKLQRHLTRVHSEEMPFSCTMCERKFKFRSSLRRHLKTHKGKTVLCDVCGKKFSDKSHLSIHKRKHTENFISCGYCEQKFYSRSALKLHTSFKHDGNTMYSCDICGKNLSNEFQLKMHKRIHTGEKPFSCKNCDKKFPCKQNLNTHVERNHANKSVKCDLCEKYYASKQLLKTHVKNVHSERRFQCEFCSYFARQSSHLKTHIRTKHSNDRPYVCDSCGKTFARKNCLDIHMKNMHDKSKTLENEWSGSDSESE